jgi:colanic acid/amylovoran biosynthesis glycosyltransferase
MRLTPRARYQYGLATTWQRFNFHARQKRDGVQMRICVVQPSLEAVSETFIRAHDERLPGVVGVVHLQDGMPWLGGTPALSQELVSRGLRKVRRTLLRRSWDWEIERAWDAAIARCRPDVVMAEYGPTACAILAACQRRKVPLVAHFHGFDASRHDVIKAYATRYRELFKQATAIVAVSRPMVERLAELGCPRQKIVRNPCGCDGELFGGADPLSSSPTFVAVGRFVEKKAPHLTLTAFAHTLRDAPSARLRMIGDGPLLSVCRDLAGALDISHAVTFLGPQAHEVVQREMQRARAFLQHSVVASDGDSEGLPVAVLEAGAIGLPVIATRHAGIPDAVIEEHTGLLVEERDVHAMALHMLDLLSNPARAKTMGDRARVHVRRYFTMERSLSRLARVLETAAREGDIALVKTEIEAEFPT